MTDVFVSYSRKDKDFVKSLFERLAASGKNVWVDWENIPLTADWLEEIKSGIEAADSFIFIISPDSVHSDICAAELSHALDNKKRLIPIMHRDLVEEYDQAALHPAISSHNWLFFRDEDDFDEAFAALVNALDADLDHMRTHTRLLVRAKEWADRQRDSSLLLRGNDLSEAEEWLTVAMGKRPEPTELHTEYIMQSHNISNARQRSTLIRVTMALVVSVGLAILSLVLFGMAQRAEKRAAAEAEINSSLAVAARAQLTTDRELAIALAVAASQVDNMPALVERSLADVVYAPGVRHVYDDPESDASITQVSYSQDGQTAFGGSSDTSIVIWEVASGQVMGRLGIVDNEDPALGHTASITGILVTEDGDTLFTASEDGRVLLWNVSDATFETLFDADSEVTVIAPAIDSEQILVGTEAGSLFLLDVETASALYELGPQDFLFDEGDSPAVSSVAVSPNDPIFAIAFSDGQVVIWAADTATRYAASIVHQANINRILFTPDGRYIITASDDEYAYKLSARTLRQITEFAGHTNRVLSVDISPDGDYLLTTSRDRTVVYWNIHNGNQILRLWAHDNWVTAGQFSADGRRAISGSQDSTLIEWDLIPGNIIQTFSGHTDMIRTVDMSSDETRAVSGSDDNSLRVWDLDTGQSILPALEMHSDDVRGVKFTPDGTQIVSVSHDSTALVWDAATGEIVAGPYQPHGEDLELNSLDISPNGIHAITGADDGSVVLWDLETGEIVFDLVGHTDVVLDVRISTDGLRALSASEDSTVRYWDLETGETIFVLEGHGREALSVAFSPDGAHAVSGSRDAEFFWWDLETGTAVRPPIIAHGSSVRGADYNPDGLTAMSASADLLMFLWDLEKGEVIREFRGHERTVYSVDFSSDGARAISGSRDGKLILWRVDNLDSLLNWMRSNREVRHLTEKECELYRLSCEYSLP